MASQSDFEAAAVRAKSLPEQPNEVLLQLYSLFKQASVGDVQGDKPGLFDFVGRAKYEAWEARKGMPQDDARQAYIDLVDRLGR